MDIQALVEKRDLHLADDYNAAFYAPEFDFDALLEDLKESYPSIDWSPAFDCISQEAEKIGLDYEDMTEADVLEIANEASCFLSEEDAEKYDAIQEASA